MIVPKATALSTTALAVMGPGIVVSAWSAVLIAQAQGQLAGGRGS